MSLVNDVYAAYRDIRLYSTLGATRWGAVRGLVVVGFWMAQHWPTLQAFEQRSDDGVEAERRALLRPLMDNLGWFGDADDEGLGALLAGPPRPALPHSSGKRLR